MSSMPITHIWFKTHKSLSEVSEHLQLNDVIHDAENYWEWIIGNFGEVRIDITRAHTEPRGRAYVRVFRLDNAPIADNLKAKLIQFLESIVRGEIFCGSWIFTSGNDFEVEVAEVHHRADS